VNAAFLAMGQTFTVGRLFGIRIGVHASWLIVFALMTIALAHEISGVARGPAFALAAVCALGLFASVVVHELAHAAVARRFGVRTSAITLFLFGGVAMLEREPPTPKAETLIALAGPLASALLGGIAFGALALLERFGSGSAATTVASLVAYLALANLVLAAFNVIPALPPC
jgi:Zn-dependent protease